MFPSRALQSFCRQRCAAGAPLPCPQRPARYTKTKRLHGAAALPETRVLFCQPHPQGCGGGGIGPVAVLVGRQRADLEEVGAGLERLDQGGGLFGNGDLLVAAVLDLLDISDIRPLTLDAL